MAAQTWMGALAAAVVTVLKANSDLYPSLSGGLINKIEVGLIDPFSSQDVTAADCDYISVSVPHHGNDTGKGPVGFCQFPTLIRISVVVAANPQTAAELKMQSILSQVAYILTGQKGSTPFGLIGAKIRASELNIGQGTFEHNRKDAAVWMISGSNESTVLVDVDGH